MRALTIAGLISDREVWLPEPGFVVDATVEDRPGDMEFLALDGAGRPLARTTLPVQVPCGLPSGDDPSPGGHGFAVCSGVVAYPEETEAWHVLHRGRPVHVAKKPAAPTEVTVEWPAQMHAAKGSVTIMWKATHADCMAALGWTRDGGRSWQAVAAPTRQTRIEVDLSLLPGGPDCLFELMVTDGWTTERLQSKQAPSPERGWAVRIVSPRQGESLASGDRVGLLAYAYHVEERVIDPSAVHWHSSIDASLGVGAALAVRLTPGRHRLVASAHGAEHQIDLVVADG
jgi:hypothetical protein